MVIVALLMQMKLVLTNLQILEMGRLVDEERLVVLLKLVVLVVLEL